MNSFFFLICQIHFCTVFWFQLDSYLLERYPVDQTEGPFYNSTVGVRFPLTKEWMESNKNKPMDVRCMAKVADTDVLINKTNLWLRQVPDHSLSQERHILNSGKIHDFFFFKPWPYSLILEKILKLFSVHRHDLNKITKNSSFFIANPPSSHQSLFRSWRHTRLPTALKFYITL